jgi:hypothetical protein
MEFLNSKQASQHLWQKHEVKLEPETLANLRYLGTGPEFVRRGKWVFYRPEALDRYAAGLLSEPMRSTREPGKSTAAEKGVRDADVVAA